MDNNSSEEEAPKGIKAVEAPSLEALKNNPDVLWIGKVMVDYAPNYIRWGGSEAERKKMERLDLSKSYYKTLKYLAADVNHSLGNEEHQLAQKIMLNLDKLTVYKTSNLQSEYDSNTLKKQLNQVDTVITFDPKTYEEQVRAVSSTIAPEDIEAFRLAQLVYYDAKQMMFKTIPLAVAPLKTTYNKKAEKATKKPLFWLKPTFINRTPDLNAPSITWAKRLHRPLYFKDCEVLKQTDSLAAVIDTMMADIRKNAEDISLGSVFNHNGNTPLSTKEIKSLGSSVDTIITFDPNTFEEFLEIVKSTLDGKDIASIRLLQDWYWDEEANALAIHYIGFKPIINRYDDQGNFLNSGPIFTRKVNSDKFTKTDAL